MPAEQTLIGRATEQAILSEQLDALKAGRGGCVVIEGEAGIGKSRLAGELIDQAGARGILTLRGAGEAIERASAFHGWRAVFRAAFGLTENDALFKPQSERIRIW